MMMREMEVVGEAGPQKYKAGQLWQQLPKVIILPPASPPPGGVKPKVTDQLTQQNTQILLIHGED